MSYQGARDEAKEINKHNKEFIADVNQKMGSEWKLTYSNTKKNLGFGASVRNYSIKVEMGGYYSQILPLIFLEHEPKLDRESFKSRVDLVCKGSKNRVWIAFKEQYDKIYNTEKLVEALQISLTAKPAARSTKLKI